MAKRNRQNGKTAIERRLAEGRGQGRGQAYQPWLRIQDVPSRGLATRIKSPLTNREHHFLSCLERDWFLVFQSTAGMRDIREQFPLLPQEETLHIAEELAIAHPCDPKTKDPVVMTTDFVVTLVNGLREVELARSIKPAQDLASPRTLEKLEIERRYWQARKVDWRILTDEELPRKRVTNLRWLHPFLELKGDHGFSEPALRQAAQAMERLIALGHVSLANVASTCDGQLKLRPGTCLAIARYLIAVGRWVVDLDVPIDPSKPLQILNVGRTI